MRYHDIYFDFQLNWKDHVNIKTNRARSTLKAFLLLGNSVRWLGLKVGEEWYITPLLITDICSSGNRCVVVS